MTDLLNALFSPDMPFFRYALISGLLASIAFGCIGTFVVVRRISYLAGAISHCALGGIGAGLYCQTVLAISWFTPITGAFLVSMTAAVLMAFISLKTKEREDSLISALWAGGMATGLLFIAVTPGYFDPMSYLFGNILLITINDCYRIALLDLLILVVVASTYNRLVAICFDEEFARLRAVKTQPLYLLLLCLTALTIVFLVRMVGIIMVIALLTLPAAIAGLFARNVAQMMTISTMICGFCISCGLVISYLLDLPSGAVIILLTVALYLASLALKTIR